MQQAMTKEEKKDAVRNHKLSQLKEIPSFLQQQLRTEGYANLNAFHKQKEKPIYGNTELEKDLAQYDIPLINPNEDYSKIMTSLRNKFVRKAQMHFYKSKLTQPAKFSEFLLPTYLRATVGEEFNTEEVK